MDTIKKALTRLNRKERGVVLVILKKMERGEFMGLDVKKLKGRDDIFRVRKGNIRIIYRVHEHSKIFILAIERRSEKTYHF